MPSVIHRGSCLCGAVRFEAAGAPIAVAFCHCRSCRRHTGAPVAAFVDFEVEMTRFFGDEVAIYASSPGVRRGFCGTCGSTLSYQGDKWPTEIHLHLGAFDNPEDFPATDQPSFREEQLRWLHVEARKP
jgi:hypothetical protein